MSERKDAERLKYTRFKAYDGSMTESLASMFVRRGLPDDFDGCEGLIEEILLTNGCGAYMYDEKDGRWVFGTCGLAGEPDAYGYGKIAIVSLRNGVVKQFENWRKNKDVVVAFNTPTRIPDHNIPRYAAMLAEVETSLMSQLMNSRQHPIPLAADEKSRVAIQEALADMDAGKLRTILSPNVLKNLIEEGVDSRAVEVLNISDPTSSDHIQYIAKLRDDLLRWFGNLYGHNAENNGKLAQQSVAEVASGASISMIVPHTRYHERQLEAQHLKEKLGWDVTIEFSEPWQNSFARCEQELKSTEEVIEDERSEEDNEVETTNGDSTEAGSESDEV